jgi:hypothetical protein
MHCMCTWNGYKSLASGISDVRNILLISEMEEAIL